MAEKGLAQHGYAVTCKIELDEQAQVTSSKHANVVERSIIIVLAIFVAWLGVQHTNMSLATIHNASKSKTSRHRRYTRLG